MLRRALYESLILRLLLCVGRGIINDVTTDLYQLSLWLLLLRNLAF